MIDISSSYIRDPTDGTLSPALVLELQGMILEQVKMHTLRSFTATPKATRMHHKTQEEVIKAQDQTVILGGSAQRTGPSHWPFQLPAKGHCKALFGAQSSGAPNTGSLQGRPHSGIMRQRTKAEVSNALVTRCCL